MTPKGAFFGPKNVSNQFLVKNRSDVQNFMKIAPATFYQRTVPLALFFGSIFTEYNSEFQRIFYDILTLFNRQKVSGFEKIS
jgi:hypothetical protein